MKVDISERIIFKNTKKTTANTQLETGVESRDAFLCHGTRQRGKTLLWRLGNLPFIIYGTPEVPKLAFDQRELCVMTQVEYSLEVLLLHKQKMSHVNPPVSG